MSTMRSPCLIFFTLISFLSICSSTPNRWSYPERNLERNKLFGELIGAVASSDASRTDESSSSSLAKEGSNSLPSDASTMRKAAQSSIFSVPKPAPVDNSNMKPIWPTPTSTSTNTIKGSAVSSTTTSSQSNKESSKGSKGGKGSNDDHYSEDDDYYNEKAGKKGGKSDKKDMAKGSKGKSTKSPTPAPRAQPIQPKPIVPVFFASPAPSEELLGGDKTGTQSPSPSRMPSSSTSAGSDSPSTVPSSSSNTVVPTVAKSGSSDSPSSVPTAVVRDGLVSSTPTNTLGVTRSDAPSHMPSRVRETGGESESPSTVPVSLSRGAPTSVAPSSSAVPSLVPTFSSIPTSTASPTTVVSDQPSTLPTALAGDKNGVRSSAPAGSDSPSMVPSISTKTSDQPSSLPTVIGQNRGLILSDAPSVTPTSLIATGSDQPSAIPGTKKNKYLSDTPSSFLSSDQPSAITGRNREKIISDTPTTILNSSPSWPSDPPSAVPTLQRAKLQHSDEPSAVPTAAVAHGSDQPSSLPTVVNNKSAPASNTTWQEAWSLAGATGAEFGAAVATGTGGSYLAIGSPQSSEGGSQSGKVDFLDSTGIELGKYSFSGKKGDELGRSVTMSGDNDVAAVGANGYVNIYRRSQSGFQSKWKLEKTIKGDQSGDFGRQVMLSQDGQTLIISAPTGGARGKLLRFGSTVAGAGQVYVYSNAFGQRWLQVGSVLEGDAAGDRFGSSISVSSDGAILAVGASSGKEQQQGYVRIYRRSKLTWNSISLLGKSTWKPFGLDLEGHSNGDNFGWSVSLSSSGHLVAVGATQVQAGGSGYVESYAWSEIANTWQPAGLPIWGSQAREQFGSSLSLTQDGQLLAIGADAHDNKDAVNSGSVQVLKLCNVTEAMTTFTYWQSVGSELFGKVRGKHLGASVALSADGKTLVAGGPLDASESRSMVGDVLVYNLEQ